jgi:hypothetical protein
MDFVFPNFGSIAELPDQMVKNVPHVMEQSRLPRPRGAGSRPRRRGPRSLQHVRRPCLPFHDNHSTGEAFVSTQPPYQSEQAGMMISYLSSVRAAEPLSCE